MSAIKKTLLILCLIFSFNISDGQQTPLNPLSYWVFIPYIYNPAIIGSKDFMSIDMNATFQGKSGTQILSANTRVTKTMSGYYNSPDFFEFKNIGVGGSVFHDINGLSRNAGASVTGSYQFPLNNRKISFLSIGASAKGVFNTLNAGSAGLGMPLKRTFYPNFDVGIYYYGPNLYAGISSVNLLGNPGDVDSLGVYEIPIARQYFFTAGYKIIISRQLNMVLEPSVLINTFDSTFNKISDNINPIIKFYAGNFCVGTYFRSNGKTSFFTQFRYPKFYVGVFFELPRKTPFFKSTPTINFTAGLNIIKDKSRLSGKSHW
jgi:type IX secretion system PorP/SprF family membrane protein